MAAHARSIEEARPQGAAPLTFPAISASGDALALDADLFGLVIEGARAWAAIGRLAERCDEVAAEQDSRAVRPEDERQLDEAHAAYHRAFAAAMAATPQTAEGQRVKLEWLRLETAGSTVPESTLAAFARGMAESPALSARH